MDEQRSQPIVENSLTELAFIFFFILLIFSSLKMNDLNESIENKEVENKELEEEVSNLVSSLDEAVQFTSLGKKIDPKELFAELAISQNEASKVPALLERNNDLSREIEQLETVLREKLGDEDSAEKVAESLIELKEISELINELQPEDKDREVLEKGIEETLAEKLETILQRQKDIVGQNVNLRNKVAKLGNGLDHPPCWADPVSGNIQYLYNVVINEDSLEFHPGWPKSREVQALNSNTIMRIIGSYHTNSDLWSKSLPLFRESVKSECRHFVRVYDDAISKKSFKSYLLGIENHFYKLLSREQYERIKG